MVEDQQLERKLRSHANQPKSSAKMVLMRRQRQFAHFWDKSLHICGKAPKFVNWECCIHYSHVILMSFTCHMYSHVVFNSRDSFGCLGQSTVGRWLRWMSLVVRVGKNQSCVVAEEVERVRCKRTFFWCFFAIICGRSRSPVAKKTWFKHQQGMQGSKSNRFR